MSTPEKHEFDKLARDYFISQGFSAVILSGKPERADVVAWHSIRQEFAIVEVKGPAEQGAVADCSYSTPDLCGKTREETWQWLEQRGFKAKHKTLAKLLAWAITSQLYRYWHLQEEHIADFRETQGAQIPQNPSVCTYLALPTSYEPLIEELLQYLHELGVSSSPAESTGRISVVKIFY
jgi:hypothetical protein